MELQFTSIPFV